MNLSPLTIRVFWAIWFACMLLGGMFTYFIFTPLVSVRQETCDAIRPGMTLLEVSAIVGGPPGSYDGIQSYGMLSANIPEPPYWYWLSEQGIITVKYDKENRVASATHIPICVCDSSNWADVGFARLKPRLTGSVAKSALAGFALGLAILIWRYRLITFSLSPFPALEGSVVNLGVRLTIGPWAFGVYAFRRSND
jgi:hypothetical protein